MCLAAGRSPAVRGRDGKIGTLSEDSRARWPATAGSGEAKPLSLPRGLLLRRRGEVSEHDERVSDGALQPCLEN